MKENLTTISMDSGTTAQEIVDAVIGVVEEFLIPLEHVMVVTTDFLEGLESNQAVE